MAQGFRVAVAGAATTAGKEIIRILEERNFPVRTLAALETQGSLGTVVQYRDRDIPVQALKAESLAGADIAFFASTEKVSGEYARGIAGNGCTVIDTTACFRMEKDVPLVVPEINAHRIAGHKGIISGPSPAGVQAALVLYPIHRAARIRKVVLSTYQAVSDLGETALSELTEQIADLFNFRETRSAVFKHQMAFNVIPQTDAFQDNAYTAGEMHLVQETRRILEDDALRISATSVLVPLYYCHCQSMNIETEGGLGAEKARKILERSPGISVEDNPAEGIYPLPVYAAGRDECFVGRIREDLASEGGVVLWSVSDNIRRGVALNAVQIAEHLAGLRG
jgi:aspartate-semialdehyde dehydrogenase